MASSDIVTPDAIGPIRDTNARRVCSLNGISAQTQLVSFRKLRDGLDMTIRELDSQHRRDRMILKARLVTKFTKASCDAFIGMAAGFIKVMLPGAKKPAELIKNAYGAATPLAEAAGTTLAGGTVDWVKTGAASAREGAALVTRHKDAYEILLKTTAVKVEVIHDAINGDHEGVVKTAASYVYDLHTKIAEMLEAERLAAFAEIAKQTFEYNEQIGKAFDEMLESGEQSEEQYRMLKATISSQAKRLSAKIKLLEDFLQSCEPVTPRVLS